MEIKNNPPLSSCQENALNLLMSSSNVFLTGQAGTGKTFLLRHYQDLVGGNIPVVASTGRAALLVNGTTFHSFFGLGIMEGDIDELIRTVSGREYIQSRLRYATTIIIDEISMLSGTVLYAAEQIARKARRVDLPWGGIRIIAVGDFAQLPPVCPDEEEIDWAFKHQVWEESEFKSAPLKTIMRTNDLDFINVLNAVRKGEVPDIVDKYLTSRIIDIKTLNSDDFNGTRIFARRKAVLQYNLQKLHKIKAEQKVIETKFNGPDWAVKKMIDSELVSTSLTLKVGALVMVKVNNLAAGYANGTLAWVEAITPTLLTLKHATKDFMFVLRPHLWELKNDQKVVATAEQFPVVLGWAITIHGAQGTTIERAITDLSDLWEWGQAYTCISRLTSGDGLFIKAWNRESILASKKVMKFYKEMGL